VCFVGINCGSSWLLMIVVSPMGNSMWCFIKSKAFELVVDGASMVLRILGQSQGIVCSICLGKVSVAWMVSTVEAMIQEEGTKDFTETSKVGSQVRITL
jgi:hypothetical protein